MIVIGVIAILFGLLTLISAYDASTQIQNMNNMMGGTMGNFGKGIANMQQNAITDSYIKGGVIMVIGIILSIIGTKFVNNKPNKT